MEFTEKLILAVRCKPIIYDKKHPDHCKRHLLTKAWEKVSEEAGLKGKKENFTRQD